MQVSSVLQLFSRNLDEGLVLLRVASELCMVLKALGQDPNLYADWCRVGMQARPR
jgi:hypothetical protein